MHTCTYMHTYNIYIYIYIYTFTHLHFRATVLNRELRSNQRGRRSINMLRNPPQPHYEVHYKGWDSKYDEWITEEQILEHDTINDEKINVKRKQTSDGTILYETKESALSSTPTGKKKKSSFFYLFIFFIFILFFYFYIDGMNLYY